MGSQAGVWLIILTVAVAVGIGFLVPVLFELHRSTKRLTSSSRSPSNPWTLSCAT